MNWINNQIMFIFEEVTHKTLRDDSYSIHLRNILFCWRFLMLLKFKDEKN